MRETRTLFSVCLTLRIIISSVHISAATVVEDGTCPTINVLEDFDVDSYLGKWYLQQGYNNEQVSGGEASRCASEEYSRDTASEGFIVTNEAVSNTTGEKLSKSGTAVLTNSTKNEAKFEVTFEFEGVGKFIGMEWILDTDYDNFAVLYSCEEDDDTYTRIMWVMSREQNFQDADEEESFFTETDEVFRNHDIDPTILNRMSQSDCD